MAALCPAGQWNGACHSSAERETKNAATGAHEAWQAGRFMNRRQQAPARRFWKEVDMDKVVAVVFDGEKQAYEGLRAFRDLHKDGSITLYSAAVVAKDASGKLSVREGGEIPEGTFFGLLTGGLIGILGGPIGVAVGASTGTMIGATFDLVRAGIGDDFVQDMSEYLLPGKAAVITELDEDWQAPIDTRMEALGGDVLRRNSIAVEDAFFERQIAADREELAALKAELKKASDDRKARLEARIQDTRHKLQEKQDQLKARIESTKREGDAKIKALQQQLTAAREERKQRLEKRLAEVRADYRERAEKLHQAWELTKSALR
jgi:uncharacterized membrane protein